MVIRKEMGELLEKTMAAMSDNDRQMLDLLHRAGLSRKEIAEKLALPLDTIQARCERAHSRLRESLSRHFTTVTLAKLPRQPITLEEIQKLRPAFRQAITVRHLENLPHPAAALRLALPEATYRIRLQSAYEMLKCGANADFTRAREQYKKAPQTL
jgi:DNA-directed RNA polymerase specialized sigma24 family protein